MVSNVTSNGFLQNKASKPGFLKQDVLNKLGEQPSEAGVSCGNPIITIWVWFTPLICGDFVDGLKVNLQLFQIAMSQADELDLAALALNEASGWSGTKNERSVTVIKTCAWSMRLFFVPWFPTCEKMAIKSPWLPRFWKNHGGHAVPASCWDYDTQKLTFLSQHVETQISGFFKSRQTLNFDVSAEACDRLTRLHILI